MNADLISHQRGFNSAVRRVRAIALNTWRETLRDRLLGAVWLIFALAAGLAIAFERQAPGAAQAVPDLLISLSGGLGALVALFLGSSLVHKELDRRTLFVVLAKPVARGEFLFGKYLGLLGTLATMGAGMGLGVCAVALAYGDFHWPLVAVLVAQWLGLCLLTALTFCFAAITSGLLAAVYAGGLFLLGQHTLMLRQFGDSERHLHWYNFALGRVMYVLLPNFQVFDFKNDVLYDGRLPWHAWAYGLAYGLLMSAAALTVASLAWASRELL